MELINKQLPGGGTALTLNLRRFSYGERAECTQVLEQWLKLIGGYT